MTLFDKTQDANYLKKRTKEYADLYRTPRALYQAVKVPVISGTTGVTSIPATRKLTDANQNFTTVRVNSKLRVRKESDDQDNGDYFVASVVDSHNLLITQNWPYGSTTNVAYDIIYQDEYGDPVEGVVFTATTAIPFLVILQPNVTQLTKYGYDRPRDAILVFAAQTLSDASITPGVGDRFIDDEGREQEITDIRRIDYFTNSGIPMRWVGSSEVTAKKKIIP